jgi:hypothetical protein
MQSHEIGSPSVNRILYQQSLHKTNHCSSPRDIGQFWKLSNCMRGGGAGQCSRLRVGALYLYIGRTTVKGGLKWIIFHAENPLISLGKSFTKSFLSFLVYNSWKTVVAESFWSFECVVQNKFKKSLMQCCGSGSGRLGRIRFQIFFLPFLCWKVLWRPKKLLVNFYFINKV